VPGFASQIIKPTSPSLVMNTSRSVGTNHFMIPMAASREFRAKEGEEEAVGAQWRDGSREKIRCKSIYQIRSAK
jgi:hypothetical protein